MPPGASEDAVNMMATCAPQQRAGQLTSLGLTAEVAEQVALRTTTRGVDASPPCTARRRDPARGADVLTRF